jgi:hypothetical protein
MMNVGSQFKLIRALTAIDNDRDPPAMVKLDAGTVVTVAAFIRGSAFVQITSEVGLYEVLTDDLAEAGTPV